MKRNKKSLRNSVWLFVATSALVPSLAQEPIEAASPTITVTQTGYDKARNEATIKVTSSGMITMPGGNTHFQTATLVVNKNGIYSFEAQVGNSGEVVKQSVHVTEINSEKHRTNNANIKLNLGYKDERSGIQQVRMRNENEGAWSPWRATANVTNRGAETINWRLDDSKEGDRSVYVQFKDRAGNVTPGEAYDKIIYDISGPTFTIDTERYYLSDNSFKLNISELQDTYSPVAKVSIKVGNQPFVEHTVNNAFIEAMESGIDVIIPASERTPGQKKIQVIAHDDLGNASVVKEHLIYYDNVAPAKGNASILAMKEGELKVVGHFEGGRLWNESLGKYVTYSPADNVRLVDSSSINLKLDLGDAHSGVVRDVDKNGLARVDVIEYNVITDGARQVVESSREEVKSETYITQIKADGSVDIPWELSYGLEKQLAIVVYDNAGNSATFYDEPIYMSALNLEYFKIKDVVNPLAEKVTIDFTTDEDQKAEVVAGGNVGFELGYNLLTAKLPERLYGSLEVVVRDEEGYNRKLIVSLDDVGNPEEGHFMIPTDAPIGSKVYLKGWLKAEFEDNPTLEISFPTIESQIEKEIGIVTENINNLIQFRSVQ